MAQNIVKRRIVEGALKGDVRFHSRSPNLIAFFFGFVPFQYSPFFWHEEPGPWGWGGGDTPLNKLYRFVPPQKGRVFAAFWSENEYRLCLFCSGIGFGF